MFVSEGKLFHHSNKRLSLPSLVAMCSLVLREQENIWHIWHMVGEFSFKEAGVTHPLKSGWASRANVAGKTGDTLSAVNVGKTCMDDNGN